MKDVMASLPEVIKEYKGYNLLIPTATDVQLNPFYKFHVEEVAVDLSETSGDIFKVGSVDTGRKDDKGNKIYADVFSLSKPLLNKIGYGGPEFSLNPETDIWRTHQPGDVPSTCTGSDAKSRRDLPDGDRSETKSALKMKKKSIGLNFLTKPQEVLLMKKQAKAAAEIFKGTWTKAKNKWGKTVDAYVIDEVDREKYIERSVMVNMALLKKTWAEKAITGAKLRVIRALLGVKGTYTKEELKKNFAIPTVVFSPDYSEPSVRQAMLTQGISSVNNMFGVGALPVKRMDFENEGTFDVETFENNLAFQSDASEDDVMDVPENIPDEPHTKEPTSPSENEGYFCDGCGIEINERVYEYSLNKYGRPLCIKCQRGGSR